MITPVIKIFALFLLAWTAIHPAYAETSHTPADTRISLGFTEQEKADFLSEMRQMLASIQGVISGIAEENPEKIIQAATYSGNRMARDTPASIKRKTPEAFKDLGGPTHMMFEELAIRAQTDDMQTLTEFTGELMRQCLACHALFRAN